MSAEPSKIIDLEVLECEIKSKNLADFINHSKPEFIDLSFYDRQSKSWKTFLLSKTDLKNLTKNLK